MKFIILNEKHNPHLKRKEVMLSIEHTGGATPSAAGMQLLLSKEFQIEPEKIEIKNIFSLKGRQISKSRVFIWDDKKVEDFTKPKEASNEPGEVTGQEEKKEQIS